MIAGYNTLFRTLKWTHYVTTHIICMLYDNRLCFLSNTTLTLNLNLLALRGWNIHYNVLYNDRSFTQRCVHVRWKSTIFLLFVAIPRKNMTSSWLGCPLVAYWPVSTLQLQCICILPFKCSHGVKPSTENYTLCCALYLINIYLIYNVKPTI